MRILLCVLLLTACTQTYNFKDMDIIWHIREDINDEARKNGFDIKVNGFAKWDNTKCEIFTRAPRSPDDYSRNETLIHELRHCQEGHFHK